VLVNLYSIHVSFNEKKCEVWNTLQLAMSKLAGRSQGQLESVARIMIHIQSSSSLYCEYRVCKLSCDLLFQFLLKNVSTGEAHGQVVSGLCFLLLSACLAGRIINQLAIGLAWLATVVYLMTNYCLTVH